jgi:hypothetical protein
MIAIEAVWLAQGHTDLRHGMDTLLSRVVRDFGAARARHAYIFANASHTRLKVLVYDGAGLWLCTRRLQSGRFDWTDTLQDQGISIELAVAQTPSTTVDQRCVKNAPSYRKINRKNNRKKQHQKILPCPLEELPLCTCACTRQNCPHARTS